MNNEKRPLIEEQLKDTENLNAVDNVDGVEKTNDNKAKGSKVGLFFSCLGKNTVKAFSSVGRWAKRAYFGGSKELTKEQKLSVENIENPTMLIIKNFFGRKLAVVALFFLIAMFIFVFLGPIINPIDLGYFESLHTNVAPGKSMMKVPKELDGNIDTISSFSSFTVALSKDGKVYTWGNTKLSSSTNQADISKLPEEVKNQKVLFAAAGSDHAIAITEGGKVIGWGEKANAQYGNEHNMTSSTATVMPEKLLNGTIVASQVKQLVCGRQVSAIVMKDGSCYIWGNNAGASNMRSIKKLGNIDYVAFTNTAIVAVDMDGKLQLGTSLGAYDTVFLYDDNGNVILDDNGQAKAFSLTNDYLATKTIKKVATTSSSIAVLTTDNKIIVSGSVSSSATKQVAMPKIEGEIIDIMGGAKHYSVLTADGKVYSFGDNNLGQCKAPDSANGATELIGGAFQTYAVDANGKVVEKWGLKGYLMGSDELGRDVAARVMNGGKTTMTIGAVAVIISSIIGIIVGCISGYFGGWVDMVLMRITEVFASLPFLPFALILSAVMAGSSVSESTRMFIIMVILGLLSWTGLAHMIRGQVLVEREKEFVTAAKAMGVPEGKIAFRHILPNVISIILVSMTLDFAGCMLTEASLSYLGFGVQLPSPTWGNMLNGSNNETVIVNFWWRWLFPSIFLLLTTISINIIGDTLRDVMDPKSTVDK